MRTGSTESDAERTYRKLKQELLFGGLDPDVGLVEASLAKHYGVSRTPVREALRRLEADRLVHRSNGHYRVRLSSSRDIYEIYEVRGLLESSASELGAVRRTDVDLMALGEAHRRFKPGKDLSAELRINRNKAFHLAVWQASHNQHLVEAAERVFLITVQTTTLLVPGRWERAHAEHEQILDRIEQRDADGAREAMAQHIHMGRDLCLRHSGST